MDNNSVFSEKEKVFNVLDSLYYFDAEIYLGWTREDSKVLTKDGLREWYFEELKDDDGISDVPFNVWIKNEMSLWTLRDWIRNIKEHIKEAEESNDEYQFEILLDLIYALANTQAKAQEEIASVGGTLRLFYEWVENIWTEQNEVKEKN